MEFLNKIIHSFFSPHLYNAEARAGKGIGVKFIFALTVIATLVAALELGSGPAGFLALVKETPAIVRTFPAMTMTGTRLSIDKPVPYDIKLGDSGLKIVIDTSYKMTDLAALKEKVQDKDIVMLLTQDAFIGRGNDGEVRIQDFKNMQDFTARHEDWEELAQTLEGWGISLIIVSAVILLALSVLIYNFIATFFSAIVLTTISFVMRASLDFDAAMRLAAIARLPAGLICLLPFVRPGVSWLIWVAYLVFAVVACRQTPASQTSTSPPAA